MKRQIIQRFASAMLVTSMLVAVMLPVNVRAESYSDSLNQEESTEIEITPVDEIVDNTEQSEILSIGVVKMDVRVFEYTGEAIEPQIEVYDNHLNIVPSSEYSVKYKNNVKVGDATITVTGKGDKYIGSKSTQFSIIPLKPIFQSIKPSKNSVTVKWHKVDEAQKYEVLIDTHKEFNKAKKYTVKGKTYITIKKLNSKKKYFIKMRAVGKKDKGSLFNDYKTFKTK